MDYLKEMSLFHRDEMNRLRRAQAETIDALDEATESGDQQFADAATSHLEFLTKELERLWDERYCTAPWIQGVFYCLFISGVLTCTKSR